MSKTKKVNIPRHIEDPEYRYKMPVLESTVKEKGINVSTTYTNLPDVAKALKREPMYIVKFIGFTKGAATDKNFKIKGKIDVESSMEVLDQFIEKFVICPHCGLPDTRFDIKTGKLYGDCLACGHHWHIGGRDRLIPYIIKNPPKDDNYMVNKNNKENKNLEKKEAKKKYKLKRRQKQEAMAFAQELQGDPLELDGQLLTEILNHYHEHFKSLEKKKDKSKIEYMYRMLRAYKIPLELSDRLDYLIFNGVFGKSFTKESIERLTPLVKQLYIRSKREKVVPFAFLLNMQHNFYQRFPSMDFRKAIGNFMFYFYNGDPYPEDFLARWKNDEITHILEQHFLYDEEGFELFKEDSKDFLNWATGDNEADDDDDEDGNSSDSDSDSSSSDSDSSDSD